MHKNIVTYLYIWVLCVCAVNRWVANALSACRQKYWCSNPQKACY